MKKKIQIPKKIDAPNYLIGNTKFERKKKTWRPILNKSNIEW
jgi:hypothetical protein